MAMLAYQHHLLTDFDGAMHYFSGEDIYRGNGYRGWGSHFWPPLYPLLAGAMGRWINGTTGAELVSVISAVLLLWVAHRFVYRLSGNNIIACLAQLLIAVNYTFVVLSIKSENHMLDSLFYVWALLLLIQGLYKDSAPRYFWVGIVCGLAGLSRYTSYSLLPAFVLTLFCFYPYRRAFAHALCIVAGFVLISSPWWVVNWLNNGSPLSTWQYMNIGAGVFSGNGNKWWWFWSGIDGVHSVTDIISAAPGPYLFNFGRNIIRSFFLIIFTGQITGLICLIALGFFVFRQYFIHKTPLLQDRFFLPLIIALACYIMLVSQAFVFTEVFLSWQVLIVIYGVFAFYRLSPGIRLFKPAYRPVMLMLIVMVAGFDFYYTNWQLKRYITDTTGMEDNNRIVAAIKAHDSNMSQKVVMSFHPARAYYLGSGYIMLPPYYQGDVSGLVTYNGMSYKVRDHAPRFPSTIDVNNLKVDYLIYDKWAAEYLPQFSFLLDKNSPRIPPNFQLVYMSPDAAVYRINGQFVHR
jgi:hypothetical protein